MLFLFQKEECNLVGKISSLALGWSEELRALGNPCFDMDGAEIRSGVA